MRIADTSGRGGDGEDKTDADGKPQGRDNRLAHALSQLTPQIGKKEHESSLLAVAVFTDAGGGLLPTHAAVRTARPASVPANHVSAV